MENNLFKSLVSFSILALCSLPIMADEVVDSVNIYQNQVVNSHVTVQSYDTLKVNNVTVSSIGKLELLAAECIVISSGTSVELGGTLRVDIRRPYVIRFDYDASGNMIERWYDVY